MLANIDFFLMIPFLVGVKWHLIVVVFFLSLSYFFLAMPWACGILIPWPGIEPGSLAMKAQNPNHWTAREFPPNYSFNLHFPNDWSCWASFQVLIGHLNIFVEMSVQIFCPL